MALPYYAETTDTQDGQLQRPTDLNYPGDSLAIQAGGVLAGITGIDNAMVDDHPMTYTVSGLTVTFGDTNTPPKERIFVQRCLCDYIPAQGVTFAANSTGTDRTDIVCIQAVPDNSNTFTVDFEDGGGNVAPGTGYTVRRNVAYQVLTGGGSIPTGWVEFATVIVRAGASAVVYGDVQIVFTTLRAQIAALVSGGSVVTEINDQIGEITLESSDGSLLITTPGDDGVIDLTVASQPSVFRQTGTTPSGYSSGENASVALPNDGQTYDVVVQFTFYTPHNGSSSISNPGDAHTSDFASVQGSGYNSGTITTIARCVTVGAGQTLNFPLACFGGTIDGGVWVCDAVSRP
jgi:hypothetical protein